MRSKKNTEIKMSMFHSNLNTPFSSFVLARKVIVNLDFSKFKISLNEGALNKNLPFNFGLMFPVLFK